MNETTMAGHDHVVQVSSLQRNVPVLDPFQTKLVCRFDWAQSDIRTWTIVFRQ